MAGYESWEQPQASYPELEPPTEEEEEREYRINFHNPITGKDGQWDITEEQAREFAHLLHDWKD
jgi:hypothetical protein